MRRAGLALLACLLLAISAQAAKQRDPVLTTLAQLEARGGTQATDAQAWRQEYMTGKRAARVLRGAPQDNMRGVLATLTSLAQRSMLANRAAPAFLILQRNLEWFYEERNSAPAYGTRTTFAGSELIWQFYPGSGWQLQPLANFGRLNGLLKMRAPTAGRLERFADDLLATGVQRRGFLAFEYYFPWDGGAPGWISGMATATGMQAFANLGRRDGDTRYVDAAHAMLGAFRSGPPWGVTVQGAAGPSFLLYSQAPSTLVGNGIAQAVIALDNYRATTGDPDAGALVDGAVAEARRLLPRFDTGAWSLYDRTPTRPGIESDLSYHQLFQDFLGQLCTKFGVPFCAERDDFARYQTEPVAIGALGTKIDRKHRRLIARLTIAKRGTIAVTLARADGTPVRGYTADMLRGRHTLTWTLPSKGDYTLAVRATSLNGIRSDASAPVTVPSVPRPRPRRGTHAPQRPATAARAGAPRSRRIGRPHTRATRR